MQSDINQKQTNTHKNKKGEDVKVEENDYEQEMPLSHDVPDSETKHVEEAETTPVKKKKMTKKQMKSNKEIKKKGCSVNEHVPDESSEHDIKGDKMSSIKDDDKGDEAGRTKVVAEVHEAPAEKKASKDKKKSSDKPNRKNKFSGPQTSSCSDKSDSVVPNKTTNSEGPAKTRYARARRAVTDQNVPDLVADMNSAIESEHLSSPKLSLNKHIKHDIGTKKNDSEDDEECLNLDETKYRKLDNDSDSDALDLAQNSQGQGSANGQDDDSDALDLDVGEPSPKIIVENIQGVQGCIRGRFSRSCNDPGSDSDPFEVIED